MYGKVMWRAISAYWNWCKFHSATYLINKYVDRKKIQIFYKNNPEQVYFKTKRFGGISPFFNGEKFAKKQHSLTVQHS